MGLYNSLENGYYSILDKIQRVIPVYSIADPIDKVFPSFVLVLILLIAGIGGAAYWYWNQQQEIPEEKFAFLKITDSSNSPLQNADISVTVGEQTLELQTDPNGIVKIRLIGQTSATATVSVNADGFQQVKDREVQLKLNQTATIKLEAIPTLEGPLVVKIADSESGTIIQGISISVTFDCEQSANASPSQKVVTSGTFTVQKGPSCGKLYTNFSPASGYQEKNHVEIYTSPQTVSLDPMQSAGQTGAIDVVVKDETGSEVEDVEVHYKLANDTSDPASAGTTDSQGKVRMEGLEPGTYEVAAYNPADGRTMAREVNVIADETASITLRFAAINDGKKLFFRVVDSETSEPISQVTVTAYDNSIKLGTTGSTNSQGIFEKNVDQNTDSGFSAILYFPGYVLQLYFPQPVDRNETEPEKIAFEKQKNDSSGAPDNYGNVIIKTQNEDASNLPNTTVNLFRDDYPNPLRSGQTGSDANIQFVGLPPSDNYSYFATAESSQHDANGSTASQALTSGNTITLTVQLVTGTGQFKVTTVDFENPSAKLAGIDIRLFKINAVTQAQETVMGGTTDYSGTWESEPLKINQNFFIDAKAVGRKRAISGPFALSRRDQLIEETLALAEFQSAPDDPCTNDQNCTYPQTCETNTKTCQLACADSADCETLTGYYCATSGLCELPPENYCDESVACNQSCQICSNNQCTEPAGTACTTNAQCCGIICDSSMSQCRNPTNGNCTTKADCGNGSFECVVCGQDSVNPDAKCCRKPCTSNEDCPAGNVCNIAGYCEQPAPSGDIKISFEGIRGENPADTVTQLQPGKTYHALFRLQLSRQANWSNVELHFRLGPDSDPNANDQNGYIWNIYSIPGAQRDSQYPQYSGTTDLSNVYETVTSVNPDTTARQGVMRYSGIVSQTDYPFFVKFRIREGKKIGTPLPLFFQARGENNGTLFNTERHSQILKIGGSVCSTNCPAFVWTFLLGSANGTVINPAQSLPLSENQQGEYAYKIFYSIQNTSTRDFLNSALEATADNPVLVNVKTNPVFSGEAIIAQNLFGKGLENPIVFETNQASKLENPDLELALVTAPPSADASAKPVIKLQVQPQASLLVRLMVLSEQTIYAVVEATAADGSKLPVQNATIRYARNYNGEACTDYGKNPPEWVTDAAPTDSSGMTMLAGLSMQNTYVLVEASATGYRKARLCQNIGSTTQTFGEPLTCLKFHFPQFYPNAGEFPGNLASAPKIPTVYYNRPTGSNTTDVPLYLRSDCSFNLWVAVASIGGLIEDNEASIEGMGSENSPLNLNSGGIMNGTLHITSKSPLGYIPIRVMVKKDGVELSRFIAGKVIVQDPGQRFAIVSDTAGTG